MVSTMLKYKILRIRNKLSFSAFMNKQTIAELILTQIMVTHRKLLEENSIPLYDSLLA